MKTGKLSKLLALVLALVLALGCLTPISAVQPETADEATAVTPCEDTTLTGEIPDVSLAGEKNAEPAVIMVQLDGETEYVKTGDLELATRKAPQQLATLKKAELTVESALSSQIEVDNFYSLLFNGFTFTGEAWMVEAINQLPGYTAFVAPTLDLIEPTESEEQADISMSKSTGLVGATNAWDYGYTGEGMVVAIVDTGIRQTHEAFSVAPSNPKIDEDYLEDIFEKYGDKLHAGNGEYTDGMYYSEKLAFNWDYFDNDAIPNHTASDHGSHVAGIAAGNNGKDFKGVAPDAQIVTMQVFTNEGGASFDTLLLALEDCVYLGVDAINMSLGLTAGFTAYEFVGAAFRTAYEALENAGVAVCVAAGNDDKSVHWTNVDIGSAAEHFAWNTDIGLVGAPATFPGSFAVASAVNMSVDGIFNLNAYGKNYFPSASVSGAPTLGALADGEYDLVWLGVGKEEDYAGVDVTGKIVFVKRGDGTFTSKATNALNNGAAGILIMNNVPGTVNTGVPTQIPYGVILLEEGEALYANLVDGVGKITVSHGSYRGVKMASTSSWGTTADLRITPEITAPGDNITSSIGASGDASYATWSGTSMATPHVAGGMLLVKERLNKIFPEKSAAEINELAHAFLMSTAHQTSGFVRQSGAGLMDLNAALTTEAYLSVPGAQRPKLELDDSEDGSFTFSFVVHNFGKTVKSYAVNTSVLTEKADELEYYGYRSNDTAGNSASTYPLYREYNENTDYYTYNSTPITVKTMNGTTLDVTELCDITAPGTVTVPAGGTVTVSMTIKAGSELMAYIKENFEAGIYLEGYITLDALDADGVDLSIPFLGYVGDWDYVPMFDLGFWWQLPYGEYNLSQACVTAGTYIGSGMLNQGLGLNPYWDSTDATYLEDRNAISPNGDGYLDSVSYLEFSMMRNPRTVRLYLTDAEGNELETFYESSYTFRKEYYVSGWNGGPQWSNLGGFDYAGNELEENETSYIVLEAWLDHDEYDPADNMNGRMVFPVTKDLTAPAVNVVEGGIEIVDAQFTAYYAIYADAEKTELICEDGVFAMERGEATFVETDLDTFYVVAADYARNEAFYQVENGVVTALDEPAFAHEKTIFGREMIDYEANIYEYSWRTFNAETPNVQNLIGDVLYDMTYATPYGYDFTNGFVADDGTLYASTIMDLYKLDPETYEPIYVAPFTLNGVEQISIRALMKNPDTGEAYVLANPFKAGLQGYHLCKLNVETGDLEVMWRLPDSTGYVPHVYTWTATIIDGETLVIFSHNNAKLWFVNLEDGSLIREIDSDMTAPNGESVFGINGTGGNMLYDEDSNRLYVFGNWAWFRNNRYNCMGVLVCDLNTNKWEIRSSGPSGKMLVHGLYFTEDMKPEDYYVVKNLIDAIGDVTVESGEAIDAAREAYENLSDKDKARVDNYEDLLAAEHMFVLAKAEKASFTAAKYYADLVLAELAEFDTTDLNAHQLDLFNEAVESFKAALAEAKTSEEIAAALEALFAVIDNLDTLCPSAEFSDVDAKAWYHDAIDYAVGNGLMNGMGDGTFAPNAEMTRAQLVTVLYRMAGSPSVEGIENPFKDVAENAWFVDAVLWAADNGIVNGTSADTFSPNAAATREQFVTILYRYTAGEAAEDDKLADVPDADRISDYAREAMNWAVANGLIQGDDKGQVNPLNSATRAEIATLLMRFCESN